MTTLGCIMAIINLICAIYLLLSCIANYQYSHYRLKEYQKFEKYQEEYLRSLRCGTKDITYNPPERDKLPALPKFLFRLKE